jgi:hypothetical protein
MSKPKDCSTTVSPAQEVSGANDSTVTDTASDLSHTGRDYEETEQANSSLSDFSGSNRGDERYKHLCKMEAQRPEEVDAALDETHWEDAGIEGANPKPKGKKGEGKAGKSLRSLWGSVTRRRLNK